MKIENSSDINIILKEEISLTKIIGKLWEKRLILFKSILLCLIFGLVIGFLKPKEYRSEVTLLIENSKNNKLNGLAQQFGGLMGLGNFGSIDENALIPDLYPEVVKSTPFLSEILNKHIYLSSSDTSIKVSQFLKFYTKNGIIKTIASKPSLLLSNFRNKKSESKKIERNPLYISPDQDRALTLLKNRIIAKKGKAENTLVITVEFQNAEFSANLADTVVNCLTKYIVNYHIKKLQSNVIFIGKLLTEAKSRYINAQKALAVYSDKNINVISETSQAQKQNLQSEYNLTYNLYNSLAQQFEQAQINLQESTPVFSIIEPSKIALKKSRPSFTLIIMLSVFLGFIFGSIVILYEQNNSIFIRLNNEFKS